MASAVSPRSPRSPALKATSCRCRRSSNIPVPGRRQTARWRVISRRPACARASCPNSSRAASIFRAPISIRRSRCDTVMPFEIDTPTLIVICTAISVVLFAEAVYLLGFSGASYRKNVNRRLKISQDQPDREAILIQLRRERGLTSDGLFSFGMQWLNRLILESGMTGGRLKLALAAPLRGVLKLTESLLQAGGTGLFAAMLFPFILLVLARKRRHGKFGAQFPDAMDIIVRSLRAGHPVPVAIGLVAQELADPIGTEFGIAADEITYGADVETAMRNLYFRVGQEDLPLFVTAVAIQGSTGGNLSEILSNLSAVIRLRFKMRRKIRALAAEGKFSALFLSGLPIAVFFLLNVMTPNYYMSIWQYDVTKIGLGCAAGWMLM